MPVVLKEGSLAELTITLASLLEGGGEVTLHGLDLKCTSASEESMVFYDAVESSLMEGSAGRFTRNFVADLRIDEFRDEEICDTEPNDGSDKASSGVDLLEQAIGTLLGKFNLVMTETKIALQGPQNYQLIAINVPRIEACQTAGLAELFIEAVEGFTAKLLNREKERTIISVTRPFPVSINFSSFFISAKNSAPFIDITPDDVVLLREFARIYKSQGLGADIRQKFGLDLRIKDPVILLGSSLQLTTVSLHMTMGDEIFFEIDKVGIQYNDELFLACPSIRKSLPSKLEFSKISISKHPTILRPLFDSYKKVLSSSSHTTSLTLYLKIDEIEFKSEHTGKMSEIEVNMDSRQWAIHVGKFTAIVNSTMMECSRVSIFRSIRGPRVIGGNGSVYGGDSNGGDGRYDRYGRYGRYGGNTDADTDGTNGSHNPHNPHTPHTLHTLHSSHAPSLHSPFAEMATVVEGNLFVGVITVPEEYFLLRSRLIDDSNVHYHISADRINIKGSAMTDWDNLFNQVVTEGDKQRICYTASILHLSVTEMSLTMIAEGIEAIQFSSKMESITDLRMELIKVSTDKMSLMRKALTVSLDPHFKPLVISNRKIFNETISEPESGSESEWSVCLSGAIISIPVYDDSFQTLWKQLPFSNGVTGKSRTKWHVQLSLCSIQTRLPDAYQEKIAPHTLYMDKARLICDGNEPFLLFLQRGEVFFAPGPGLVMPVTGLFDEGHNYWEEQNYEALGKFDFLPISLTLVGGFWQVRVENNMITVDLFKDSVRTVMECVNLYLQLVRDQRIKDYSSPLTDNIVDREDGKMSSVLECIYEMDLGGEFGGDAFNASPVVDSKLAFEKSTLDLDVEQEYYSYGAMDCVPEIDLEGMIELPLPENLGAEETEEGEELNFEQDFFATKMEDKEVHFPFSDCQDGTLARVQIADFSIAIRMHSGRQWNPNRSNHVGTKQETPEFRERRSTLSSSASSRWSNLGGSSKTSSFRTIPKDDSVEFVIRGMNAELDWSNPFPPELVAPDMILAAIRMAVKKVEIVDHVRSSRWKTFLTRRIAKGEARPMVQLKMEMNFVDREEPRLLPEDQLEATIKLDVEPLRLHIDQDTLLFMLRFLDSKPTRRDVSPMFFGLSYNCD